MGLSCGCYDDGEADWYADAPNDFTKSPLGRRKRCCSCKKLIPTEAVCIRFRRWRHPSNFIEERIFRYDGEVKLAPYWMCETCGDLYFSLVELEFCVDITENMHDLVREYAEMQREARRP